MQRLLSSSVLALVLSASVALAQQTNPSDSGSEQRKQNQSQNQQEKPIQNSQSPADNNPTRQFSKPADKQTPSQAQQPSSSSSTQPSQAQQPGDPKRDRVEKDAKDQPAQVKQPETRNQNQTQNKRDERRDSQSASVNLSDQQRTRISQSISQQRVRAETNVNFNISVGTNIPRNVRLYPLPAAVLAIVPQYRGYSYLVVRDEIVIVEPRSYRIVAVIPQSGGSHAATRTTREDARVQLSAEQRARIRSSAQRREIVRSEVVIGQPIPADVELYEFPESLYVEVPTVREYRYYTGPRGTVLVDPRQRRVIEIIQ